MLKLGVLDQSPIGTGGNAVEALRRTIELAQAADRLGYSRYWVSEHHNTKGLAGSSPEVLIASIAAQTSRIRVGSGGVLLPHYSPFKVAENFRVLEGLYPNRIDLGIGRAPGGMPLTSLALRNGRRKEPDERFPDALRELAGFLTDSLPPEHPYASVRATPLIDTVPEFWLLGSSDYSARLAAELGGAFSFAHFINGDGGHEAVLAYRRDYRPGPLGSEPRVNVCVIVLCAETEQEAEELASCVDLRLLLLEQGHFDIPFPTPEEAAAYPYTEWDRRRLQVNRKRMIVGDPEGVRTKLLHFAAEYGASEVLINTIAHDHAKRVRSYEWIAEAFGLPSCT